MTGPTATEKITPSKLKYKHVVMLAEMLQPYVREIAELRQEQTSASNDGSAADAQDLGMAIFERMLGQATSDLTKLIASMTEMSEDEVQETEIEALITWFEETWELNDVPGFIERVKGLIQRYSQSQLQNLSNASTAGQTKKSKS